MKTIEDVREWIKQKKESCVVMCETIKNINFPANLTAFNQYVGSHDTLRLLEQFLDEVE